MRLSSSECTNMVVQFGWGLLSTQQVQTIAALAKKDRECGCKTDKLDAMASVGSQGEHPGNAYRDLMRNILIAPLAIPMAIVAPSYFWHSLDFCLL